MPQVAIPVYETATEEWIEPLGTSFPPEHQLSPANFEFYPDAKLSAQQHSHKSKNYRMSSWAGLSRPNKADDTQFVYTNDLDKLTPGLVIDSIRIYYDATGIKAIQEFYTNRTRVTHGIAQGFFKDFSSNGRTVLGVQIAVNNVPTANDKSTFAIYHIAISWDDLTTDVVACKKYKPTSRQIMYSSAPAMRDVQWDLAGFYSTYNKTAGVLECVGVIWGNDIDRPTSSILPSHMDIENFPPGLKTLLTPHLTKYDKWRLSDWAGSLDFSNDVNQSHTSFEIAECGPDMRFDDIVFHYNMFKDVAWALCGMVVNYSTLR